MGNTVEWTKDQKAVIELRNRDILVSAAAGSGKTAVLVERIIEKITDVKNPCDIDRLLVVTFTKAAAAEMRSRIGEALEKRLLADPENEHIQRQMSLLHGAQISTIDSFCQWIVKNYFHVIHLDPVYRIADPSDLDLMKREVLEEFLEEKYLVAKEKEDSIFFEFTELFSTGRTDHEIEDLILNFHEISTSMPYPEEWIISCGEQYEFADPEAMENSGWMQGLMEYLRKNVQIFLERGKTARNLCLLPNGPVSYLEAVESDLAVLEHLCSAGTFGEYLEILSSFSPARLKAIRDKSVDAGLKEKVQALREGYMKKGLLGFKEKYFFQSGEEMFSDIKQMSPYIRKLASLVLEFHQAFQAKKEEEALVDFSDVEHFALEILVEKDEEGNYQKRETARELQNFYDEIMIDEYQDSNEVQELILTSLCGGKGQKPTLFMVGDVKQSIYKFRMAKPEIFMEKYKRFSSEAAPEQRIDLHQNFRSRTAVLEAANFIFEQLMTEEFGGITYDEAAKLVPGAYFEKSEKKTAEKTEILLIDRDGLEKQMGHVEMEASAIGQKIRDIVQGEDPLYVKGKNGYHPVEYRDISILLRTMSGWSENFVQVLNDMGIPAHADTKTGYFTSLEVETLLSFLHVIDNPRQDIPLAAVLRSVFANITDEELAILGSGSGQPDFWDQVLAYVKEFPETELGKKLCRFQKMLERYQEYAQTRSVYELLQKIYEETGYYHQMSAMPSGEKRMANLDILLEQSVEFAKNGHSGIYRFARYIENLRKADVDFGEASVSSENTNAVRIMSIHKSKGLEFPVVFVAGLGKLFNVMDTRKGVLFDGSYGVGCDFVDASLRIKQPTLVKSFLANRMRIEILEEEVRVFYVALTRAKEKLYLTGCAKNLKKILEQFLLSSGDPVDYHMLSTATTYLHWIGTALFQRSSIADAAAAFLEGAEEEEMLPHAVFADDLFSLEILSYRDLLSNEVANLRLEMDEYGYLKQFSAEEEYDTAIRELLEKQEHYRYPFLHEAELPVKISVSELKRRAEASAQIMEDEGEKTEEASLEDEKEEIPKPEFLQEESMLSGAARGTLYHLVMEHFPYRQIRESDHPWTAKEFDAFLLNMVDAGYMTGWEKEELDSRRFVRFQSSDIGRRMAAAAAEGTLHLEQPFMMGLPASRIDPEQSSDEMILVQGIIDAFFFQPSGQGEEELVLVDYKTDFVKWGHQQELVKKYQAQLNYYAQALERLTGRTVAEKVIYSFSLGEEIAMSDHDCVS